MPQESNDEQKTSSIGMFLSDKIKLFKNNEEISPGLENTTLFKFYPDGTGDANSIQFEQRKHKLQISTSPLSGSILPDI